MCRYGVCSCLILWHVLVPVTAVGFQIIYLRERGTKRSGFWLIYSLCAHPKK
jgi:hypothetical protein